jgi:hypothetical protein
MKAPLLFFALALCAGCAHTHEPFVQDGIRIVPPVTEGYDKAAGTSTLNLFNDGGTRWVKITDAEGKKFDVYFDHRLVRNESGGFSKTSGGIYLMAYPGHSNSVWVVNQQDFKKKIGDFK